MVYVASGDNSLNAAEIDEMIKGFYERSFNLVDLCTKTSIPSMTVQYYRETVNLLSVQSGFFKAEGAEFRMASPLYEKNTAYMREMGLADEIFHTDLITNRIDIWARKTAKVAEAIRATVDSTVFDAFNGTGTQTATRTTWWDNSSRSSRHPIDDLAAGIDLISRVGGRANALICSPYMARFMGMSDDFKSTSSPAVAVNSTGEFQSVAWVPGIGRHLTIAVTNYASDDAVLIADTKKAVTWNDVEPLKSNTVITPGVGTKFWAWRIGAAYLVNPGMVCKISDTKEAP